MGGPLGKARRTLALTACLAAAEAAAPFGAAARAVTWDECVALAARANPELLGARRALEAGSARYRGSFNALLPRLSLANRFSDSKNATGSGRWSADGTASLDVLDLGAYARVAGASAALGRAEADLRLRSAELRRSLRRAFAELLFAQELEGVAERIRGLRRRNAELVELKYDSGRESKGNMLRARAERAAAEAAVAQSARARRVAQRELSRRLGLDRFEAVTASGTLRARAAPEPADPGGLAASHPAVLQASAAQAQARAGLRESKSALWPAVSASYTRRLEGPDYFPSEPAWSAGASLSLPILGGGPTAAYNEIRAARHGLGQAEQALRASRLEVESQIEASWAALADSVDQLEVTEAVLEAARQRNEESSVRYSSGLMTFETWELVVTDLVAAERGWVRARRDASLAEADWDRALGRALEDGS